MQRKGTVYTESVFKAYKSCASDVICDACIYTTMSSFSLYLHTYYLPLPPQNQTSTIARPPGPPPTVSPLLPPDRKPRSHTVATDGLGTSLSVASRQLELSSSMEGSLETSTSSWGGSSELERQSTGGESTQAVLDGGRKPTPPPPPPQNAKPGRRDPPVTRPKPFQATGM